MNIASKKNDKVMWLMDKTLLTNGNLRNMKEKMGRIIYRLNGILDD